MSDNLDTLREMVRENINDTLGAIEKSRESMLKLVELDVDELGAEPLAQLLKLTGAVKESAKRRAADDEMIGTLLPIMAGAGPEDAA